MAVILHITILTDVIPLVIYPSDMTLLMIVPHILHLVPLPQMVDTQVTRHKGLDAKTQLGVVATFTLHLYHDSIPRVIPEDTNNRIH